MKKIIAFLFVSLFVSQSVFASQDTCRQYAYGYMSDGKVYMMLAGKKYGPFDDVNQLKFTLERMGPQFKESLRQYMLYNPNGGPDKYLVLKNDLGDCNPYVLDMDTIDSWNTKITVAFRKLDVKFAQDKTSYRNALWTAIANLNSKIATVQGSQRTLEILKLIRDRFQSKYNSL